MTASIKTIERNIGRLTRELEDIDKYFYRSDQHRDRGLYLGMLERKRDDIVRSTVLQLHTAIEDLMNKNLTVFILGSGETKRRSKRGQALGRMLHGSRSLGFDMKLNFSEVVGVLNADACAKLRELNTLRNKCSHNWLLKVPVRRGKKPKAPKPPLLTFRGRDLHKIPVLKDFCDDYSTIYLRLFANYADHT